MFNIKEEDNTPVTTVKLELIKKINSLTEEIEDNEKSIQRLKDEIKNSGFTKTESFFIEKKGIISTTLGVITFFAVPIAKIPFALAAAGASFSLPFFYEEEKRKEN